MSSKVDDLLLTWFHYWGVTPVEIEEDMKETILEVLSNEHTVNVYVDEEGGLVIEGDE